MPATVTVIFGGKEEQKYVLDKPSFTVGREPTCEIAIDNLGISRQHCKLINRGDAFVVRDLGSANGTFVNGKKIVEHFLNDGDEIFIGKYILRFSSGTQIEAAPGMDSSGVPDTLNTFVMDGAKIQEQLAKMRAQASGSPAAPSPAPVAQRLGATAKDYAQAMDVQPLRDGNKNMLLIGGAVIVLLLILVAVLLIVVMRSK